MKHTLIISKPGFSFDPRNLRLSKLSQYDLDVLGAIARENSTNYEISRNGKHYATVEIHANRDYNNQETLSLITNNDFNIIISTLSMGAESNFHDHETGQPQ